MTLQQIKEGRVFPSSIIEWHPLPTWSGLAARITLIELCLSEDLALPALLATGLAWLLLPGRESECQDDRLHGHGHRVVSVSREEDLSSPVDH